MRRLLRSLIVAALLASTLAAAPLVDSIAITVSDLDRSVDFYSKVLNFQKISEYEAAGEGYEHLEGVFGVRIRAAQMQLGDEKIELMEYLAPKGRPVPPDSRGNDRWFQHIAIIVSDMDQAYAWLRQNMVQHASSGPQRLPGWNKNAGGIQAFYFRDPDGHFLEILAFPPDKGDAKWHGAGGQLFLGIDHTAIVVSDTEASLHFYRDLMGMTVAGESENFGVEQEHLNNVFGARLHITSLRAAFGPGVEFLEYFVPRDGRPYPTDSRASDLVHWQTRFSGIDTAQAAHALRKAGAPFLSSGVVELPDAEAGFRKSLVIRDPDGHAVQIAEP